MAISLELIAIIIASFLALDLVVLLSTGHIKQESKKRYQRKERLVELVGNWISEPKAAFPPLSKREERLLLEVLGEFGDKLSLSPLKLETLHAVLVSQKGIKRAQRDARSSRASKRARCIRLIPYIRERDRLSLCRSLLAREKTPLLFMKLMIIALERDGETLMDDLVAALRMREESVQERALAILTESQYALVSWATTHRRDRDPLVRRILLALCSHYHYDWSDDFLAGCLEDQDAQLRRLALEVASQARSTALEADALLASQDPYLVEEGIRLILHSDELPSWQSLARFLDNASTQRVVADGLASRLRREPALIPRLFEWYAHETDSSRRRVLAQVLSSRLPWIMRKLPGPQADTVLTLVEDLISADCSPELFAWLARDHNSERLEALCNCLRPILDQNDDFRARATRFLRPDLKERLGLGEWSLPKSERRAGIRIRDRLYLGTLMIVTLAFIPGLFILLKMDDVQGIAISGVLQEFLVFFNSAFAIYAAVLNLSYLALMLISSRHVARQKNQWALADRRFLFTPGVMPSVSIIAPAWNEEKTILQSVHSLLSLVYPAFEVIVVNDGSSDHTLSILIDHFKLEPVSLEADTRIESAPVLGVWRSPVFPKLTVVDKQNGGKADSLNAGIARSKNEYVCSIDADSLLESESLLKILYRSLATNREMAACGGNIIPINGCRVEMGRLERIHFPKAPLAKWQTVEYLRSFIAGRMGWARLNALLIISGAFGVFRRDRLLEVGGYLSGRSALAVDTVGEDLEVVIRLARRLRERKIPFTIDYAHNANCWTEVPEDLSSLLKQRDRWHRGLMENMIFHRKLLFNPRYRAIGLLAIPYFHLFELLGPFLEATGYLMLLVSLVTGLVPASVVIAMFILVSFMGVLVSLASFYLAERGVVYFQDREYRQAIRYSIAENFGYRQFMSLQRPISYIKFLFKSAGWQKIARKGF